MMLYASNCALIKKNNGMPFFWGFFVFINLCNPILYCCRNYFQKASFVLTLDPHAWTMSVQTHLLLLRLMTLSFCMSPISSGKDSSLLECRNSTVAFFQLPICEEGKKKKNRDSEPQANKASSYRYADWHATSVGHTSTDLTYIH